MNLKEHLQGLSNADLANIYHDLRPWYDGEVFGYPQHGFARVILIGFGMPDTALGLGDLYHYTCVEIATRTIASLEK
jgi:hypothetical protein